MKITKEIVDSILENPNKTDLQIISMREVIDILAKKPSDFDYEAYKYLQDKAKEYGIPEETDEKIVKAFVLGNIMAILNMDNLIN